MGGMMGNMMMRGPTDGNMMPSMGGMPASSLPGRDSLATMYANVMPSMTGQPGNGLPGRADAAAPTSMGGAQNIPQLFSGGGLPQRGMGGYNAGISNVGNMFGGGQPMDPLQSILNGSGAGAPVNQMPAWQSMIQAQNYNIQQGADQLAEQFNNGGGLFSTAYGNAAGQYQEQARLGQNAQLTQAQTQSLQQALQNQLMAGQQISQQGYGAASQMSSQQLQAAMQAAQYQYGAASQQGNWANQAGLAGMQQQLSLQGLGLQGAGQFGQLELANQQIGNTLGNSQLLANQNDLTAQYQNWYNSQPQNNPLLSMMYAGATGYPQLQQPTQNPGMLGSLLGGLGGLAGGIGALGGAGGLAALLPLIGLSDRRLKENINRIGKLKDLPLYTYSFKGDPIRHVGFMAQEVFKKYPLAVMKGDRSTPWLIDYGKLAATLGVR